MEIERKIVEQRRTARRLAYMRASIVHPLQAENPTCLVRDISQDGALIDFPDAAKLPLLFWLRLEGDPTLNLCTIAWRSESQLGVEFSEKIMERRRVERWTQSHPGWARLAAGRQSNTHKDGASNSFRWSASLVCLRA